MTQLSNGDLVVVDYYNLNNNGFGALHGVSRCQAAASPRSIPRGRKRTRRSPATSDCATFQMPFTPRGIYSITPFTHGDDERGAGVRVGKFTHPSAAPDNDLLAVWTPGPANDLDRPTTMPHYDAGLYLIVGNGRSGTRTSSCSSRTIPTTTRRGRARWCPTAPSTASMSRRRCRGCRTTAERMHCCLPARPSGSSGRAASTSARACPGVGARSFDGLDAFNTAENDSSSNWSWQGADAGRYTNADIWAVRILAMEPNTHRSVRPQRRAAFLQPRERAAAHPRRDSVAQERWVRLDAEGNPDTSFLAKLPADTPFTFQTLDRDGLVLNMAQTWHQVRPGEMRADCGGCHAHSQTPLPFAGTAASRPSYQVPDLSTITPMVVHDSAGQPATAVVERPVVDVEFYRDIRPILQRSCVSCHTQASASPAGNLVLDDHTMYTIPNMIHNAGSNQAPGDYIRLAADSDARWGYKPIISGGAWRQSNTSRYVRAFQSRRSLLVWKVFGRRLDGWTNDSHPTERVPGDRSTLPPGADPNLADLDYTGSIMPPVGSSAPPLSEFEKRQIARWVDLGAPIDTGAGTPRARFGWFLDDLRPTLDVSLPRAGLNTTPVTAIRVGVADAHSGIAADSLSITADFSVLGQPPGAELSRLSRQVADGVFEVPLVPASLARGVITVSVRDNQGNVSRVVRTFSTR